MLVTNQTTTQQTHTPAGRIVPGGGKGDPGWLGSYGLYPYIAIEERDACLLPGQIMFDYARGL